MAELTHKVYYLTGDELPKLTRAAKNNDFDVFLFCLGIAIPTGINLFAATGFFLYINLGALCVSFGFGIHAFLASKEVEDFDTIINEITSRADTITTTTSIMSSTQKGMTDSYTAFNRNT
ncbi:hypothetical protein [Oceanispirochaeta sp. M1]|uniref:hypothetical protein n=1 Tax=Oceanispirochaeta sp. M1 TaxID=2283433 RepID=UPI000E0964DC|nr:hypothetical protein [Oceanispirochaeta sp. M1]NPD75321.1 hypothetical protein [Oceanispirochaeta sp. M1]RDG28844.1 hypothetical protein DV872_24810 [Oceanispirochaeta sp. M1]